MQAVNVLSVIHIILYFRTSIEQSDHPDHTTVCFG